jgi:hypothetical protein
MMAKVFDTKNVKTYNFFIACSSTFKFEENVTFCELNATSISFDSEIVLN